MWQGCVICSREGRAWVRERELEREREREGGGRCGNLFHLEFLTLERGASHSNTQGKMLNFSFHFSFHFITCKRRIQGGIYRSGEGNK